MKFVASLLASAALGLSMLVAVPTAASAAPYPGTVATRCFFVAPGAVRKNRNYNVGYSARAAGNSRPAGAAYFRVWRVKKNRVVKIRVRAVSYTGPNYRRISLGKFKRKGRYLVQFQFRAYNGSVYKGCASGLRTFKVKKKGR